MGTQLGDALKKALLAKKRKKTATEAVARMAPVAHKSEAGPPITSGSNQRRPPRVRAVRVGTITPHPLLRGNPALSTFERLMPQHNGIARQLSDAPTNAADLILGIDFGTAASKAVIRDQTADVSYAVPFKINGENRYLLPTRVFLNGDTYALEGNGVPCTHLKMRLLQCGAKLPVQEFDNACAFLALMIRHCRGWLLDRYQSLYERHALTWTINMGLPARSYEDEHRVRLFRRLVFAAANLAADSRKPTIAKDDVLLYRQLAFEAYTGQSGSSLGGFEFFPPDIDVVPEIAAQVFGFVRSSYWDSVRRPYMVLMDIGAATVDTGFFAVLPQAADDLRFVLYSTDVRESGVVNLHLGRMDWIDEALRIGNIEDAEIKNWSQRARNVAADVPRLPERAEDYLSGIEYQSLDSQKPVDAEFFHDRVVPQISGCIAQAKQEQRLVRESLSGVPLFICGGGARLLLYRNTGAELNRRWSGNVTVHQTELPPPPNFEAPGLPSTEYDRLSVAYGLSWHAAGGRRLGEVIRRAQIPPLPEQRSRDIYENYISKDQV